MKISQTYMNLDDDYDNDGNNIVPCPICLDVHCPSKEDGKCPDEDEFARDMSLKQGLGDQWQNIFLNDGTEKGLGDLSMMIGTVSKIIEATKKVSEINLLHETGNFIDELYQTGNMGDNEKMLLLEFVDEKLKTLTPEKYENRNSNTSDT